MDGTLVFLHQEIKLAISILHGARKSLCALRVVSGNLYGFHHALNRGKFRGFRLNAYIID